MEEIKNFFYNYLCESVFYAFIIIVITIIIVMSFSVILPLAVQPTLSFALLVESGIGFTLGGALDLVSSASVSKFLEQTSHEKRKEQWTIRKYQVKQQTTNKILVTSAVIFLMGLFASIIY